MEAKSSFKRTQGHTIDMTQGSIWKHLFRFALPLMISLTFQQMYNMVDAMVVGKYVSHQALAAVGSTANIINMLVSLCSGISIGASVIVSHHFGAGDDAALRKTVHVTITVTFFISLIATAAGLLLVEPALRMMSTPEDVMEDARAYLTIYFMGLTALFFYNMGTGILNAVGDSRRPLYFVIIASIVNVVTDWIFVVVFKMGVSGVAAATVLSEAVSAVLVLFVLSHDRAPYALRWKELTLDFRLLKDILRIGFPSGIQQAVTAFSNIFVQGYINAFGSLVVAGYSTHGRLDGFLMIPVQALTMALTTFVGQNAGAKQYKRTHTSVNQALAICLVVTTVLVVIMQVFCQRFAALFTDNEEVAKYAVRFIRIITPFYIINCFSSVYAGALRGLGITTVPSIIMLSSYVAFRQMYLFVGRQLLGTNFLLMALAFPVGWIVCTALMVIYYHRSASHMLLHPSGDKPAPEAESAN